MLGLNKAQVVAHDPPWGLRVVFRRTGQSTPYRVTIGRDYASAVIARQKPMPPIGSWGLVSFPDDDMRSGVWICSYVPSQADALTTTQASGYAPTDPHIDYRQHFSGDQWLLDGLGNESRQWADGSTFVAASGSGMPTVFRHIVDSTQTQQQVPYTYAERITNPPASGFYYNWIHKTGTNFLVDSSGNVTVSGVPVSGTLTMYFQELKFSFTREGNIDVTTTTPGESVNLNLYAVSGTGGAANFRTYVNGPYGGWINLNSSGIVSAEILDDPGVITYFDYGTRLQLRYDPYVGNPMIDLGNNEIAFFGGGLNGKQTVTGALSSVTDANAKAVLTSIIAALGAYSLINNGTS